MNLANKITIARIILAPVFMVFLLVTVPYGELIAWAIFILASITDALDGYIARSRKQITKFGKFLDPLADKLLITAALITLVGLGRLHSAVAVIIISREFAVTGLRVIAAGEGMVISASKLGKLKTITQVIAISAIMLQAGFEDLVAMDVSIDFLVDLSVWVAVVVTILSGIDYFNKNRHLIRLG
ncbi:CDP-diacylglycerol--glycerol-3-phosphate 3-phosphatidyltransferase [Natranaerobius thermophilus]|uniref:CDP-diacylglycerol--glycerol-3-phosphate 3-phosphatidyltransferase n=1 Tax=Natranaerobius thermophilus (strain ATCC BAA-1301 / DSM 18059 / JW/NM-WN-LF) TaxID=457570 RepID=B2A3C1_NATTJ|nr:CDP-diacylglycerol--glycerol-3-phosphate 3-phosphatidyltransferase [Natranaerobius thermophilus]ACB85051.1 CDP-diacylglycerol--glycerol-3-phosphate 3-phosphatidyltransferase [Natranaerobius thermophilus JW/NM-WN-LF]